MLKHSKSSKRKKLHVSRDLLMAKVAQLHLIGKSPMPQAAIAKRLHIDKATVSRLLRAARQQGIVRFVLNLPRHQELEIKLANRYDLLEAVIVPILPPTRQQEVSNFRRHLAEAAAQHLEGPGSPIKSGFRVGISCGATVRDLIIALSPGRFGNMHTSQLTLETECDEFLDTSSLTLVGMLHAKWRDEEGKSKAYAIQPLLGTLRSSDHQPTAEFIKHWNRIRELAKELEAAIVGIGSPDTGIGGGTFAQILRKHNVDARIMRETGAVGEICNHPYDLDGNDLLPQMPEVLHFLDGVGLDILKSLVDRRRKVIAIAGGTQKVQAIDVALRKGFVNYLITDVKTAEELCDLTERPQKQ